MKNSQAAPGPQKLGEGSGIDLASTFREHGPADLHLGLVVPKTTQL